MAAIACRASLNDLPSELLLDTLSYSMNPSLMHVSQYLRNTLPPYERYTRALAAVATCPEGPPSSNLMRRVYDRVMERYFADTWTIPLTVARKWQIRSAVWSSTWFGAKQFETIVLMLYREFFLETMKLIEPRLRPELLRLRHHVLNCHDLSMVVGEEFVANVRFTRSRLGLERSKKESKNCRGDLLFKFNSITIMLAGQEHRLSFWAVPHLYDLPDGLFKLPVGADQLHLIRFLTTLDWHWRSKAVLMPRRIHAFGEAVTWAIQERDLCCLELLLGLWAKIRFSGNEHVLHVYRHLQEGLRTRDRYLVELLCRGFHTPFSACDFFNDFVPIGTALTASRPADVVRQAAIVPF